MSGYSTNPKTQPSAIRQAFLNDDDHELSGQNVEYDSLQVDFEHGQWWVTHLPTGAQWSVHDTEESVCFEQVTEGDLDDWLAENHEHTFGKVEHARITGEPHRKCQHPGCNFVSLDLDDEENDREQALAAMDEDELRDCLTNLVAAVQDERNLLTAMKIVEQWGLE